jgi:indolepyruvate ferredoxin oxidoreductase alpha subunit
MKELMTGNEAIARGAYEAGVKYATAYPGTPSTEILENIVKYKEKILAEWASNEKVAYEAAYGACKAGARTLAAMKHVGLNVAADPMFTSSYTGVNGGMVFISADEPGHFSSQNEQDNRNYAKAAKLPMFEPANSQEAKDMVKEAFDLSEKYNVPVIVRMTTRVCHSKSIVEINDRIEKQLKKYTKNVQQNVPVPAFVKKMRETVEKRTEELRRYSNETQNNSIEINSKENGIIVSGAPYHYAKEVFRNNVSYLKLGFTNPLPDEKILEYAKNIENIYIIEENDPYIEDYVRKLGIECKGIDTFPYTGEKTPDVIRKTIYGETFPVIEHDDGKVVARPPTLCAGCPHRGFAIELGKKKNVFMSGDIGCYSLVFAEPYNAMDISLCMGAGFSIGHGAQQVFDMTENNQNYKVVSFMGDSTFFHTGINSLINVAYNRSNTVNIILDNRITGMTGHQENPGSGYTIQGKKTAEVDIEAIVKACGIRKVVTIDPNNLKLVRDTLDWAFELKEPSVIITRWPCVLKRLSEEDKEEFQNIFKNKCSINKEKCVGCKLCIKTGCPAISFNKNEKKAVISEMDCVGCTVCRQVCPANAIDMEVN